jgi:hypothetical protein
VLRIGNFSGYWGDDPDALLRQLRTGAVDYLTGDYLAELTMAIMERQRRADPRAGFAHHFLDHLSRALPLVMEKGVRIIVNAGGVNPASCREAVLKLCQKAGVSLPIGIVTGSDVLELLPEGSQMLSAHAYLGARPIVEALRLGARVVITGRVTDAALALAPMIHELGWSDRDWDRLAAGVIAGHILECGAQATGGVFTDFEGVPLGEGGTRLGYPIVEMEADGSFVVTKPDGTGGIVSAETIAEQLLYEIGDPHRYLSPDVTSDFTSIRMEEIGRDRVRVSGARGSPPPPELKVSCVYGAGFRAVGHVLVSGPRIQAKAERIRALLGDDFGEGFADSRMDILGLADPEPREAVLRFAVRDPDRAKVERFTRTLLGIWVQGPPGVTMLGRPSPEDAFGFSPALIPRERATAEVELVDGERAEKIRVPYEPIAATEVPVREAVRAQPQDFGPTKRTRLRAIAHARCGDKGDLANIGVRARTAKGYAFLERALTADRVAAYFGDSVQGTVARYDLPNLRAFNFVLERALGGGGSISLRPDPLGKTMADAMLELELEIPVDLL